VKWERETGYTGDDLYLDWVKSWLIPEPEEGDASAIPPAPPAPPPPEMEVPPAGEASIATLPPRPDDLMSQSSEGGPRSKPQTRLKNASLAKKPARKADTASGEGSNDGASDPPP
jgi:hypothetical protein